MGFVVALAAVAWGATGVGEEVSHGRGRKDGVVVLWPRMVPETDDPLMRQVATALQDALATEVNAQYPAEKVDVRPSPERVCPREGCRALSVSVLLGHQLGGCAAVALVGPPGALAQRLVPLAGTIDLAGPGVPYRDRPEDHVVIREFVPCDKLAASLDAAALQRALSESTPAP
jgi:hypothetical protein